MPRLFHLLATLILAAATTAPASAQVTLYRCTDPAGQLTVQNRPCPPGSSQREQSVGGVSSTPEPAPDRAASSTGAAAQPMDPAAARGNDEGFRLWDSASLASERALAEAAAAVAPRPPPPPLYRCSSRAGDHYLSETSEPPPQCIALRTVGLDGDPATGAGQACEVVRDRCEAVPATEACAAWQDHRRQAQTRWRLAHPDNVPWRGDEYARIAAIATTHCGD